MNAVGALVRTAAWAALLGAGAAAAQMNAAVTDTDLQQPWARSRAVVQTLTDAIERIQDPAQSAQLARDLAAIEVDLIELQTRLERIAIGIVTKAEYSYIAAEASRELSLTIGKVESGFSALYGDLAIAQREDAVGAQAAIGRLRQLLATEQAFERDVIQAIGSGSKNAILTLAGRWWAVSENVGELKQAVAALRRRPV